MSDSTPPNPYQPLPPNPPGIVEQAQTPLELHDWSDAQAEEIRRQQEAGNRGVTHEIITRTERTSQNS